MFPFHARNPVDTQDTPRSHSLPAMTAFRYALIYAGLGTAWFYLSDWMLAALVRDPLVLARAASIRGLFFVGLTAILLFALLRRRADAAAKQEHPTRRDALAALLLFALIMSGAGYAIYEFAKGTVNEKVDEELGAVARLKVAQIERWLEQQRRIIHETTETPLFADALREWIDGGAADPLLAARIRAHLRAVAQAGHHADAALYRPVDGALLLSASGGGDTPHRRALALQAAQLGRATLDDFHLGSDGLATFGLFIPLQVQGMAQSPAVAYLAFDPDDLVYPLMQQWPGASRTAETVLVRREGNEVLYLNALRHTGEAALRLRAPLDADALPAALALRGRSGFIAGRDYRGEPVLSHVLPVPGTPWMLISKVDQAEAYGDLIRLSAFTAMVVGVMLLALWWWWAEHARLTAIRHREQLEHAALARRMDVLGKQAPDCIVLFDSGGRIREVNDRTLETYGYNREQMLHMSIFDLRVPETVGEIPLLVSRLSDEGNLTYETRHRRSDGTVFPVEASTGVVDVAGERYLQSVIRDVSDRKRAESHILRLSRLNAAISESNQAMLRSGSEREVFRAVCRACVEHGGLAMAWVGLVDSPSGLVVPFESAGAGTDYLGALVLSVRGDVPEGRGPVGIALREGRIVLCNDFANDPTTEPWRETARPYGWASAIALPLRRGGRAIGVLVAYGLEKNLFDDQAVHLLTGMADNISFALDQFEVDARRQEAEAALRASEARLNEAQHIAKIGSWELDLVTNVLVWSDEAYRIFGMEPGKFGASYEAFLDLVHPDDREAVDSAYTDSVKHRTHYEVEHRLLFPDGRIKHVRERGETYYDSHGRPLRSVGTTLDITAQKRLEEARARDARKLAELSRRLVAVQEQERRRLALELHDVVSPNLAAIQLNLGLVSAELDEHAPAPLRNRLADSRVLLRETGESLREICANLRPAVLDYAGLFPALDGYGHEFSSRTGIAVRVNGTHTAVRLPADVESLLFRIAQEALTNCAKHAGASSVTVDLAQDGQEVTMTIADDGVGFEPSLIGQAGHKPGLGLLTMRERAEFAGGSFDIASHPGEGSCIRVAIPLASVQTES